MNLVSELIAGLFGAVAAAIDPTATGGSGHRKETTVYSLAAVAMAY